MNTTTNEFKNADGMVNIITEWAAGRFDVEIKHPKNAAEFHVLARLVDARATLQHTTKNATQYATYIAQEAERALNNLELGFMPSRASDAVDNYNNALVKMETQAEFCRVLLNTYVTISK